MRKRSTYRPRPVILDTLNWVKSGFKPLVSITDENVKLRLKNRMALDAVIHGEGTPYDLDVLINVSNMTTALARKHGADWREEIRMAADAIEAMQRRYTRWKKIWAAPGELDAINLMFRIHEAQLDEARINDLEKAIALAKRKVATA